MLRNIRLTILERIYDSRLAVFIRSTREYLRLYKAGFRILNYADPDIKNYERWRFFWGVHIVRDMADISRFNDRYNTMFCGRVEELKK